MEFFIYVDSLTGIDSNSGDILHPLKTISAAYNYAVNGATIVLQNGDSTSYGNLNISKNINIIAAYGASPLVGTITVTKAQCFIQGLFFSNLDKGIVINNDPFGSVQIKDCTFNSTLIGVEINNTDYIAIHRNTFKGDIALIPNLTDKGVVINSAKEVNISNNIFTDLLRAIEVYDIYRLDVWNNTIYGGIINPGIPVSSPDNIRIIYVTLKSSDISYKRIILPSYAYQNTLVVNRYDVETNSVNGPSFEYREDYTIEGLGLILSWKGLSLDGKLISGDVLRIMYVEGAGTSGGESLKIIGVVDPNSTIDSNNITGYINSPSYKIQYGIVFNTPLKINNNNFFQTDDFYTGSTPTEALNNIGSDYSTPYPDIKEKDNPRYNLVFLYDPNNRDFYLDKLQYNPDIDTGDNDRWERLSYEMGLTGSDAGVTALGTITREGVAPFNNGFDNYKVDRIRYNVDKEEKLDIGAIEFIGSNLAETGIFYVGETGSDYGNYYGKNKEDALITIDRAFKRDSTSIYEINVGVGGITGLEDGTRYGRYFSKNMELNSRSVNTNRGTNQDIIYVYPTTPEYTSGTVYVSPNGLDGSTGIVGYTGVYGETGSILYGFTGGNGTEALPFRTISKAIQSGGAAYIIVEPGFYPTFSGATGVNIIGIPKTNTITLNTPSYQKLKASDWGATGSGTAIFSNNTLYIMGTEYLTSTLSANTRIEYKAYVNKSQGSFSTTLSNPYNSVSISFENGVGATGTIKTKFFAGITGSVTGIIGNQYYAGVTGITGIVGSNYTYSYPDIDYGITGINVSTKVIINNNNVEVFINGIDTNIYKSFFLTHSYTNDWKVYYETVGETGVLVSKLSINSDSISSVIPYTETNVRHKLYGLYGSKTL